MHGYNCSANKFVLLYDDLLDSIVTLDSTKILLLFMFVDKNRLSCMQPEHNHKYNEADKTVTHSVF